MTDEYFEKSVECARPGCGKTVSGEFTRQMYSKKRVGGEIKQGIQAKPLCFKHYLMYQLAEGVGIALGLIIVLGLAYVVIGVIA